MYENVYYWQCTTTQRDIDLFVSSTHYSSQKIAYQKPTPALYLVDVIKSKDKPYVMKCVFDYRYHSIGRGLRYS